MIVCMTLKEVYNPTRGILNNGASVSDVHSVMSLYMYANNVHAQRSLSKHKIDTIKELTLPDSYSYVASIENLDSSWASISLVGMSTALTGRLYRRKQIIYLWYFIIMPSVADWGK